MGKETSKNIFILILSFVGYAAVYSGQVGGYESFGVNTVSCL